MTRFYKWKGTILKTDGDINRESVNVFLPDQLNPIARIEAYTSQGRGARWLVYVNSKPIADCGQPGAALKLCESIS